MFTIMVVEDDLALQRMMCAFLGLNGYQTIPAANGEEALDAIERVMPDLVIADVMMPVMDGYQALVGIRNLEKERNIPEEKAAKVIMTTALNDEKNVKMAFELGCTIYSGKPIDQERFEQALKKLGLV